MSNNSINISAGGNVTIEGAVGAGAKSVRMIVLDTAMRERAMDNIDTIITTIEGEVADGKMSRPIADKLLIDAGEIKQAVAKDEPQDPQTMQKRITDFIGKVNFACETGHSLQTILTAASVVAGVFGFAL